MTGLMTGGKMPSLGELYVPAMGLDGATPVYHDRQHYLVLNVRRPEISEPSR